MILINKHKQTSKAKNEKTEKITKENVEPKHSMFEVKQEIVTLQIRERLTVDCFCRTVLTKEV